jgi:O-antigen ligase
VLTLGSASAVVFSIAVSQILLGAALAAALTGRVRLRFPWRVALPLALFFFWTLLAAALSSDPAASLPQMKKLFVFAMLPLAYTLLKAPRDAVLLVLVWGMLATGSALWSFGEFWTKRQAALAAGQNFYLSYIGDRVTGFMSHWMTFSAEQMIAVLAVLGLLLFGAVRGRRSLLWLAVALIAVSIALAMTRGVWIATAAGVAYLVAVWRPKLLWLGPVALLLLVFAAPASVRERLQSIVRPGEADSNTHRVVTFRTGVEMIKAKPLLGLGPEVVGREFHDYVPEDIPKPLPTGFYGHLHNLYLQYAAERGLPALVAFLWFVSVILADFGRAARRMPALLHGAVAVLIAVLVEGLFEMNLGDSEVLTMVLAVIGYGYAAARQQPPPEHTVA